MAQSRYEIIETIKQKVGSESALFSVQNPVLYKNLILVLDDYIKNPLYTTLLEQHTRINEDALFFEDYIGTFSIVFFRPQELFERLNKEHFWKFQSRSTNWSTGPWIIESFIKDILSSHTIWDNCSIKSQFIHKSRVIQSAIIDHTYKEIQQKKLRLQQSSNEFTQQLLVTDIKIAAIRYFLAYHDLLFSGFHALEEYFAFLDEEQKNYLLFLQNCDITSILLD